MAEDMIDLIKGLITSIISLYLLLIVLTTLKLVMDNSSFIMGFFIVLAIVALIKGLMEK
jgi:hypothetical protein